jgi:hypothetical protein
VTAERDIVVEVRFSAGIATSDIAPMVRDFEIAVRRGWAAINAVEPKNACRMCGASVAWSPLCSACCGVVERVEAAITSAGGVISHREIAGRLAYGPRGRPRQRCLDGYLIHAAIDELVYRGRVATGRSAVSLARMVRLIRTEAA